MSSVLSVARLLWRRKVSGKKSALIMTSSPRNWANRGSSSTSVILVMFNSASTIEGCLASIPHDCEVVLIDQDSTDEGISFARRVRPDAKVIRAGANRGFGAGCNLGAANAEGEILIFLNPDASFSSPADPEILASAVRKSNALVGPRILGTEGGEQTRARNWSNPSSEIAEIFLPAALLIGFLKHDVAQDDEVYVRGGRVPFVQGSCMAISAENFWNVGGFDERFFLYFEEEVLARKLEAFGVSVVLEPRAAIIHIGAHSTSQFSEFSATQYYRSAAMSYCILRKKRVAIPTVIGLWATLRAMAALTPLRMLVGVRADRDRNWYLAAAVGVLNGWRYKVVEPPQLRTLSMSPS